MRWGATVIPSPVDRTRAVALAVRGVAYSYELNRGPSVSALKDVSFTVCAGQFVVVMGPSGSGKSTLLHILAGLESPREGEVLIGDATVSSLSTDARAKLRRQSVGIVFQFFSLLPTLTVHENIALAARIAGSRVSEEEIADLLRLVGLPIDDREVGELSGGEQQRVAIARAIVNRPTVLLADEPTGNLDSAAARDIALVMRQMCNERGQTVVAVTHDPAFASYGDRVLFLSDGRIEGSLDFAEDAAPEQRVHGLLSWMEKLAG